MSAPAARWLAFGAGAVFLAAMLWWVLFPANGEQHGTEFEQQSHLEPVPSEAEVDSAAAAVEADGGAPSAVVADRQRSALGSTTPEAGFLYKGRLVFPEGAQWDPLQARVFAVRMPTGNSWHLLDGLLAEAIAQSGPAAAQVGPDGRFSIRLPGDDALDQSWIICAGAPGWFRARSFPDLRPNSPDPKLEIELQMQALYGATLELVFADGSRPQLERRMLSSSGGSGVHYLQGWGWGYPLEADSAELQLGLPAELRAQAVGGMDAARGLSGPELAVFQTHPNLRGGPGYVVLSYKIAPPGFEEVSRSLIFRTLQEGFPAYKIELSEPGETGSVQLNLVEADWWRVELDPYDLGGFTVELQRADEEPWTRHYKSIPTAERLQFAGLPVGEYSVSVRTRINSLPVPVQPNVLQVRAGLEADAEVHLGGFGAIDLDVLDEDRAGWAAGRFSLQVPKASGGDLLHFFTDSWPVRLGPIQDETVVVLIRAVDGDKQIRLADRLNAADEFAVPRMGSLLYVLGGLR